MPAAGSQQHTKKLAAFDRKVLGQIVDTTAKEMMTPGAMVLVRAPEGSFLHAYGTSSLSTSKSVTAEDHMRIGSNTKTMTGTVILLLAQEGKLDLDDPVSKYRPDVPGGDKITITHLLNMRSGLFNYSETFQLNDTLDEHPTKAWRQDELLAMAFSRQPYFLPGQGYHYSNTNTVLLGLIAEKIEKRPLAAIFKARLFDPLGMTNTSLPDITSNAIPAPHPRGYMYGSNVETMTKLSPERQAAARAGSFLPADVTDENPSWGWSAGSAISTIADMATWVEAMGTGKILNAAFQKKRMESFIPIHPDQPAHGGYGLGIAKMGMAIGHTGELPGFNSFMGYVPETQTTLVVWTNLNAAPEGKAPAVEIGKRLLGYLHGTTVEVGAPSGAGDAAGSEEADASPPPPPQTMGAGGQALPAPPQLAGNADAGGAMPADNDPNHPRGKVVSSYRDDDGALALYINRGSASKIKVGQTGHVLLGQDGDRALDGGEFKISRVVDATKSVGHMPSNGPNRLGAKNNRCVIHLVPWP